MSKLFIPTSWHLMQQIKAAEAKCDADCKRALEERFERALAFNTRIIREQRATDCRRHVYVGDMK